MFRRSTPLSSEHDPIVTDRHGRVVGIRTPPPSAPEETSASRHWRRCRNVAATGELRGPAALRNESSWLHVDPPRC